MNVIYYCRHCNKGFLSEYLCDSLNIQKECWVEAVNGLVIRVRVERLLTGIIFLV